MREQNEISDWFSKHGSIPELIALEPLSDLDYLTYQSFELSRLLDDGDSCYTEVYIRQVEYNYDAKDHCFNCGYFEPNEYHPSRYGFCPKIGDEMNPTSRSCHLNIIL